MNASKRINTYYRLDYILTDLKVLQTENNRYSLEVRLEIYKFQTMTDEQTKDYKVQTTD